MLSISFYYEHRHRKIYDAICYAVSKDGINFEKSNDNPIFSPTKDWCCGRAIDADVCVFNDKIYMYVATRDHNYEIQKIAGAVADLRYDKQNIGKFKQLCSSSILSPELEWEEKCIEAPATIVNDGKIYMFYGGAYNCSPQQIGCAVSKDGRCFDKLFLDAPFLRCGEKGSWNECESGHPFVFKDKYNKVWLYYQGSPDNGSSWYISRIQFEFKNGLPVLKINQQN